METPTSPPVVKKKRAMGRSDDAWTESFLRHYETWGAFAVAARDSGVTARFVRKYRDSHPDFAQRLDEAHELFVDGLEKSMVECGRTGKAAHGFTSLIARLKAERPSRWQEKLQISGAVAHVHAGPAPEVVNKLLAEMLADTVPETRAQLTALPAGDVIEAELVATESLNQPQGDPGVREESGTEAPSPN